jgi:NAD(P)-dependent dehydrogenase (short-subunit alcohol dehydrogenase family)
MFNPLDLTNRHIVITGASNGIGRETAIYCSKLGAQISLIGRDENALLQTLNQLETHNGQDRKHNYYVKDLSDMDSIPDFFKEIVNKSGSVSDLVHCAGIQVTKSVRHINQDFFDNHMRVNLGSALSLVRGFRYKKHKTEKGRIVFVSSIAAFIGQPGNVAYAASKAGLLASTRALAMELLRDNIRVNAVAPALVATDMAERSKISMTEAQYQHMLDQHPMGIGEPVDIASAIAFLLSDASKWINGETLLIDGGYLCN